MVGETCIGVLKQAEGKADDYFALLPSNPGQGQQDYNVALNVVSDH